VGNDAFSETGEAKMKKMMLATVLALAAGATAMGEIAMGEIAMGEIAMGEIAMAQNSGSSSYTKNSPGGTDRPMIQAPVGHRQPRASDVPSEKNLSDPNNPVNREDAALDRKIKSICRGC
jgi:hypothetical protein